MFWSKNLISLEIVHLTHCPSIVQLVVVFIQVLDGTGQVIDEPLLDGGCHDGRDIVDGWNTVRCDHEKYCRIKPNEVYRL